MMIELPEVRKTVDEGNKATFEIDPLYSGYGVTLGNSLRRVLLSSLPGAAVVGVKIEGVSHEFSTLPHIKEDVVQIILNLKQLRLKVFADEPQVLKLNVSKKGDITAADIEKNSNVEIVNPELHIATSDGKEGKLSMELRVEKGIGYLPTEAREGEKKEIGLIAIDALFTPVRAVAYHVVNTRVGEAIDYDKLILEITTDGTITPEESLKETAAILKRHFEVMENPELGKRKLEVVTKQVGEDKAGIAIEELNLSTRATNALVNNDFKTVGDIVKMDPKELAGLKGLGAKALDEVMEKLVELGVMPAAVDKEKESKKAKK